MEGGRWADGRVRKRSGRCADVSIIKNTSSIYRVMLRGLNCVFGGWRNGMLELLGQIGKKSGKIF
jgi:hypothetical protein